MQTNIDKSTHFSTHYLIKNFSDTIMGCLEVKSQSSWIADISGLKSLEHDLNTFVQLENKSHEFVKYYICCLRSVLLLLFIIII